MHSESSKAASKNLTSPMNVLLYRQGVQTDLNGSCGPRHVERRKNRRQFGRPISVANHFTMEVPRPKS